MFTNPTDVREFVTAGRAVITLESEKTGKHYTYRVRQATDRETGQPAARWFVSLLTGPDNSGDYTYLGVIDSGTFRLTAKSKMAADAKPVAGFQYMWGWVNRGQMPAQMHVRHEGRCGRCGRALTVPESIDRGIGPECASKMGAAAFPKYDQHSPLRQRAIEIESLNGMWRGYTVEIANKTEKTYVPPEWVIKFVFWEGKFDDEPVAWISDIWEVEADWVRANLRPRAGLRFNNFRFEPGPILAALHERARRQAEEMGV